MNWARNSYAGNETAPYQAAVNRSMSEVLFGKIPTHQIEHNIIWLKIQRDSIEDQISRLNRIKKERDRVKAWRQNMNALAKQFMDDEYINRPIDKLVDIIQQRLGCERKQAIGIAEIVRPWAKRRKQELLHEKIMYGWRMGRTALQLHREHGVSRQTVYNIVKKHENNLLTKKG